MRQLLLLLAALPFEPAASQRQLSGYYPTGRTCLNSSRVPSSALSLFNAHSAIVCSAKCLTVQPPTRQWHFSATDLSCACISQLASSSSSSASSGCTSWSRLNRLGTVAFWFLDAARGLTNCGSAGSLLDGARVAGSLLTLDNDGLLSNGLRKDDRIDIRGMNSLPPLTAFTVTAWVQPLLSNASLPLWEADQDGAYRSGLWFFPDMQHIYWFSLNATGNLIGYSLPVSPRVGQWNYIAVSFNPLNVAGEFCASVNNTVATCVGIDQSVAPVSMATGNEFWLAGVPPLRAAGIVQAYIGRIKCVTMSTRVLTIDDLGELAGYCG